MSDFNAAAHLITLRGKGGPTEYLPVAARIAWFRAENPDGNIAVDAHTITADIAIFHARVSATNGGTAEGWGSETPRDFADYIEKASTKALGRALLALGYGTLQAGEELDEGQRIVDTPQPARPRAQTPQPPSQRAAAESKPAAATPPPAPEGVERTVEMLNTIRDDEADPQARKRALHEYYGGAQSPGSLNYRHTLTATSGMPPEDREKAHRWHLRRLSIEGKADQATEQATPAGIAG